MPPTEQEPTTRRSAPTYGLTRQERVDAQQAIWDEASGDTGRVRRRLRNELLWIVAVLLIACAGAVFLMIR